MDQFGWQMSGRPKICTIHLAFNMSYNHYWLRDDLTPIYSPNSVELTYILFLFLFIDFQSIEPDPLDIRSWSDVDQIFDDQILLSKFTSMVSDTQISDQHLIIFWDQRIRLIIVITIDLFVVRVFVLYF